MRIQLEFVSHISASGAHVLKRKVVGTDIYVETVTKVNRRSGNFGKSVSSWYHRDDPDVHTSYEEAAKWQNAK